MAYSYDELRRKTVAELREIAAGIQHDAVQGHTQMHKSELLVALCKALSLELHEHHEAKGINKAAVKAEIQEFKRKRDEAIAAHNPVQLKQVRREIHRLKRQIRRATV
jgi:folylpolyglutamate synthase/dihydropteroate synthase